MAELIEIHIWMQNKRKTWTEPEVINPHSGKPQPGRRVVLDVGPGTSVAELKVSIAKELEKVTKELLYYYVVAVMQKDDGQIGYRTIVRKVDYEESKKKQRKRRKK